MTVLSYMIMIIVTHSKLTLNLRLIFIWCNCSQRHKIMQKTNAKHDHFVRWLLQAHKKVTAAVVILCFSLTCLTIKWIILDIYQSNSINSVSECNMITKLFCAPKLWPKGCLFLQQGTMISQCSQTDNSMLSLKHFILLNVLVKVCQTW